MRQRLAVAFVAACLSGCAANVTRPEAAGIPLRSPDTPTQHLALKMTAAQPGADWDNFKREWVEAVGDEARSSGMTFETVESNPAGAEGLLLDVRVTDYKYVSPVARFLVGVMTGNASMESTVSFVDLKSGTQLGQKHYSATSSAWEGIMAPMTDRQARAVAASIMRDIRSARVGQAVPLQQLPVTAAKAEPPSGKDAYSAERLAKTQACHAEPHAVMTASGPGFESYSVACSSGDALAIRCEFGNCRVLK